MKPFTTAQSFVGHALLSLFMGALLAGLTTLAQIMGTGHTADIPGIVAAFTAAFSAWFLKGFVALEASPQLRQAEIDTVTNLPAEVKELPALMKMAHQKLDALLQRPTVVAASAAPIVQQQPFPPARAGSPGSVPVVSAVYPAVPPVQP